MPKLEPTRAKVIAYQFLAELRENQAVDKALFLVYGIAPLKDAHQRHDLDFKYECNRNRNSVEHVFHEVKRFLYSFSN